ncbi:MAG: GNAT family N-acetyltransferase [Clostridia bacterium]|nr:GNAT family N-acetyltransferase [Clostridia bacterium]
MIIRTCTSADRDAVNDLMHQTSLLHSDGVPDFFSGHEEYFTDETYAKMLAEENTVLLCAENDEGKVCGVCHMSLKNRSGFVEMKNAHIENIVVDENCRGAGIGHALMAEAEKRAREWGAVHLNLLCWDFNEGAYRLYESLGMRPKYTFMLKEL